MFIYVYINVRASRTYSDYSIFLSSDFHFRGTCWSPSFTLLGVFQFSLLLLTCSDFLWYIMTLPFSYFLGHQLSMQIIVFMYVHVWWHMLTNDTFSQLVNIRHSHGMYLCFCLEIRRTNERAIKSNSCFQDINNKKPFFLFKRAENVIYENKRIHADIHMCI